MTVPTDTAQPNLDVVLDALASMEEAMVAYDVHGQLIFCNRAFRDMYGYSEAQARPGVHFRELGKIDIEHGAVAIEDEHGEDYLNRKAAYRNKLVGSFTVKLRDGRWIRTTDRRMAGGGFVSVHVDVTEIKEIEDYLRRVKNDAQSASRAKSDFLANMSHELRTPLNAIIGFSDTIRSEVFGPVGHEKYKTYITDILHSGQHLLELINDILDVSAIEAGRLELHEAPIDLTDAIETCVRLVLPRAVVSDVTLKQKLDPSVVSLTADIRRFKQIMLNLLSNAIKFTPQGGTITVGTQHHSNGTLSIAVTDTGIGMDENGIEKAMSTFGQVDSSLSRKHDGSGLGLPLTKGLMDLHGGSLKIDSRPGQGTTVTVTFPKERVIQSVT